jgi:hypothetical protein
LINFFYVLDTITTLELKVNTIKPLFPQPL